MRQRMSLTHAHFTILLDADHHSRSHISEEVKRASIAAPVAIFVAVIGSVSNTISVPLCNVLTPPFSAPTEPELQDGSTILST